MKRFYPEGGARGTAVGSHQRSTDVFFSEPMMVNSSLGTDEGGEQRQCFYDSKSCRVLSRHHRNKSLHCGFFTTSLWRMATVMQLQQYLLPFLWNISPLAHQSRSRLRISSSLPVCGTLALSAERILLLTCNQSDVLWAGSWARPQSGDLGQKQPAISKPK